MCIRDRWIGGLKFLGLHHVGFETSKSLSPHIPLSLFMLFQMMFCTIAVSILSGSIAEKMRFIPYLIFVSLWVLLIYSLLPIGFGVVVGLVKLEQ